MNWMGGHFEFNGLRRNAYMSVYDALKDVIRVVQKADNVELYCKLLDVGSQALELQDELCRLKEENSFLKEKNNLTSLIERHQEAFITRKDENGELRYCSHCWDAERPRRVLEKFCNMVSQVDFEIRKQIEKNAAYQITVEQNSEGLKLIERSKLLKQEIINGIVHFVQYCKQAGSLAIGECERIELWIKNVSETTTAYGLLKSVFED